MKTAIACLICAPWIVAAIVAAIGNKELVAHSFMTSGVLSPFISLCAFGFGHVLGRLVK